MKESEGFYTSGTKYIRAARILASSSHMLNLKPLGTSLCSVVLYDWAMSVSFREYLYLLVKYCHLILSPVPILSLPSLQRNMANNQLTSIPIGLFDKLSKLTYL